VAKGDNLEERLVQFAVRIVKSCDKLPRTQAGNHIASQPLRCGTSPAANYAEARGAESHEDFVHKLKVALKELNESRAWLKIITQIAMLPVDKMAAINQEADELCRIVNASVKTAKANHR
jgi:four helix bundle protein